MSLNRVNHSVNDFGYRLLTPNGDVKSLNPSDLSKYRADDRDELVQSTLTTQTKSLVSLDIPVIIPAKGGAIIIASTAETAEKAHTAQNGPPTGNNARPESQSFEQF